MITLRFGNAKIKLNLPRGAREETLEHFIASFDGDCLPHFEAEAALRPIEDAPIDAEDISNRFGFKTAKAVRRLNETDGADRHDIYCRVPLGPGRPDELSVRAVIPALLSILASRGVTAIHASGIIANEQALLFAGRSGSGKSTTCAWFVARGFEFFSDDRCLLWNDGSRILAVPSFEKSNPFTRRVGRDGVACSRRPAPRFGRTAALERIYFLELHTERDSARRMLTNAESAIQLAIACGGETLLHAHHNLFSLTLGADGTTILSRICEDLKSIRK